MVMWTTVRQGRPMSDLRPGRRAALGVALLAFAAASAAAVFWADQRTPQAVSSAGAQPPPIPSADVEGERLELVTATGVHALHVEIADTPEKQTLGLMYRTHLPDTKGMLFPHDEPRELTMWMRNTFIPLDMVFIRADGTVHRIEAETEPFSERIIKSGAPVTAVLEIAGGAA